MTSVALAKFSGLVAAVLLVAAVSAAAPSRLTLNLAAARPSYRLGEPIRLAFTLRNASGGPVVVGDPTTSPRPTVPPEDWGVMLVVTAPDGRTWEIERTDEIAAFTPVRRKDFRTLAAGGVVSGSVKLADRHPIDGYTRWVVYRRGSDTITEGDMNVLGTVFSRPGLYRISARYCNRITEYWEGAKIAKGRPWIGTVSSPPVAVRITK